MKAVGRMLTSIRRPGTALGLAVAVLLHVAAIFYLSYEAGRLKPDYRYLDEVPTFQIEVQQRRLTEQAPTPAPPAPPAPRARMRRDIQDDTIPVPEPYLSSGIGAGPTPYGASSTARSKTGQAPPALKALKRCDRLGLSREELEDCEARRWAEVEGRPKLQLDPAGRFNERTDPFLSRRPEKGCRGRATGDVGEFGDDSNVRGGITCVKPF